MHSTFSQASACWRISLPRAPGPMMPRRIRWFAPRALLAANVPARPVATRPMKLRRDCMGIDSLDLNPIIYGRAERAEGVGGGTRWQDEVHRGDAKGAADGQAGPPYFAVCIDIHFNRILCAKRLTEPP